MTFTGISEQKAALRRGILASPPPDWRPMLDAFLTLPEVRDARTVLVFCGIGREPDTAGLIATLLARGKTVALPRVLPARRMEARAVTGLAGLIPGPFSIPEPGEDCPPVARDGIDVILVPNLCCDRDRFRLGQGGGYYDRYLAGHTGLTVALCPETLLQDHLPREATDVPVRLVLTERARY